MSDEKYVPHDDSKRILVIEAVLDRGPFPHNPQKQTHWAPDLIDKNDASLIVEWLNAERPNRKTSFVLSAREHVACGCVCFEWGVQQLAPQHRKIYVGWWRATERHLKPVMDAMAKKGRQVWFDKDRTNRFTMISTEVDWRNIGRRHRVKSLKRCMRAAERETGRLLYQHGKAVEHYLPAQIEGYKEACEEAVNCPDEMTRDIATKALDDKRIKQIKLPKPDELGLF